MSWSVLRLIVYRVNKLTTVVYSFITPISTINLIIAPVFFTDTLSIVTFVGIHLLIIAVYFRITNEYNVSTLSKKRNLLGDCDMYLIQNSILPHMKLSICMSLQIIYFFGCTTVIDLSPTLIPSYISNKLESCLC